jgi:hypothetical protein
MATQRIQSVKGPSDVSISARQREAQLNAAKFRKQDELIPKYSFLKNPKTTEFPSVESEADWIALRSINPDKYGYTPDGNLRTEPITGEVKDVQAGPGLEIPKMVRASAQELKDAWKAKQESLQEPSMKLAVARRALLKLTQAHAKDPLSVPVSDILIANRQVQDADRVLTALMRVGRAVFHLDTQRKELNFDWYRREVVEYEQYITTVLPLTDLYKAAPEASHAKLGVRKPLPTAAQLATQETPKAPEAPQVEKPKRQLTPQQIAIIRARNAKR